jgi:hypothetical protein
LTDRIPGSTHHNISDADVRKHVAHLRRIGGRTGDVNLNRDAEQVQPSNRTDERKYLTLTIWLGSEDDAYTLSIVPWGNLFGGRKWSATLHDGRSTTEPLARGS